MIQVTFRKKNIILAWIWSTTQIVIAYYKLLYFISSLFTKITLY